VYPTLQLLADEGLVTARDVDGKRVYELTDAGRAEAESRKDEAAPWSGEGMEGQAALGDAFRQLVGAFRQVIRTADTDQLQRATAAVHQARQALYQILAER
jgi:DNA-binding PadR family transcriptional regulator